MSSVILSAVAIILLIGLLARQHNGKNVDIKADWPQMWLEWSNWPTIELPEAETFINDILFVIEYEKYSSSLQAITARLSAAHEEVSSISLGTIFNVAIKIESEWRVIPLNSLAMLTFTFEIRNIFFNEYFSYTLLNEFLPNEVFVPGVYRIITEISPIRYDQLYNFIPLTTVWAEFIVTTD